MSARLLFDCIVLLGLEEIFQIIIFITVMCSPLEILRDNCSCFIQLSKDSKPDTIIAIASIKINR